jgi:hypothetical protein
MSLVSLPGNAEFICRSCSPGKVVTEDMEMIKRCVAATCAVFAATVTAAWTAPPLDPAMCKPSGALMRLAGLPEASGLATSRGMAGRLWAHNDSGKPELIAFDSKGNVTGHVAIAGAHVEDWEAMAAGPCGGGSCLYIGDIGDNDAERREIVIYRIAEPAKAGGTAQVDAVIRASYPDGAHDAETLLASPDGHLYVVTKGDTGPVALYRVPRGAGGAGTVRLERVGEPLSKGTPAADARITDGAISADGEWVALRTHATLIFYRAAAFLKGDFKETRRVDLKSLGEPQGEAIAFGPANTLFVAGEGGSKSQPGTLGVITCAN